MLRKIGEVFDCTLENGKVVSLQVIEAEGCDKCFFNSTKNCSFTSDQRGACSNKVFIKVEKQESDTFNSQIEIWRYLSESEDNKVVDCEFCIGFKNGELYNFTANSWCKFTFGNFKEYKKYTPPKTITVNGIEIEAPLRSLEGVDVVYVPCFHWKDKYFKDGANDEAEQTAFKNNMAFATPEAAIACHDAMLKGIIIPQ